MSSGNTWAACRRLDSPPHPNPTHAFQSHPLGTRAHAHTHKPLTLAQQTPPAKHATPHPTTISRRRAQTQLLPNVGPRPRANNTADPSSMQSAHSSFLAPCRGRTQSNISTPYQHPTSSLHHPPTSPFGYQPTQYQQSLIHPLTTHPPILPTGSHQHIPPTFRSQHMDDPHASNHAWTGPQMRCPTTTPIHVSKRLGHASLLRRGSTPDASARQQPFSQCNPSMRYRRQPPPPNRAVHLPSPRPPNDRSSTSKHGAFVETKPHTPCAYQRIVHMFRVQSSGLRRSGSSGIRTATRENRQDSQEQGGT